MQKDKPQKRQKPKKRKADGTRLNIDFEEIFRTLRSTPQYHAEQLRIEIGEALVAGGRKLGMAAPDADFADELSKASRIPVTTVRRMLSGHSSDMTVGNIVRALDAVGMRMQVSFKKKENEDA